MPEIRYEIRVVKILQPLVGTMSQELLYLARTSTEPDPGAVIASLNPTLVLPLPPPIKLEAEVAAVAVSVAAALE